MKRIKRLIPLLLALVMILTEVPMVASAYSDPWAAYAATTKVTVNGKAAIFLTYEMNNINYVKVRDVAKSLSKTSKKFSMTVNTTKNTLTIKTGKTYTAVGGENKKSNGKDAVAFYTKMKLYKNSTAQSTKVYIINKVQYVPLKELAKIADFSITYNKTKKQYEILTKYGYGKSAATVTPKPTSTPVDSTTLLKCPFPNASKVANPQTVEDCYNLVTYLVMNSIMSYSYDTSLTHDELNNVCINFEKAMDRDTCPEIYFGATGSVIISVDENDIGSTFTINIDGYYFDDTISKAQAKNKAYFTKAKAAVQSLIDSKEITATMTETQKAKAIYYWVACNVEYTTWDSEFEGEGAGSGYSAIVNHSTVCSGYTALYNLMCRYAGLYEIQGIVGTGDGGVGHMWTGQILDGKRVMTDATYGDQGREDGEDFVNPAWFARPISEMKKNHKYDETVFSDWK